LAWPARATGPGQAASAPNSSTAAQRLRRPKPDFDLLDFFDNDSRLTFDLAAATRCGKTLFR